MLRLWDCIFYRADFLQLPYPALAAGQSRMLPNPQHPLHRDAKLAAEAGKVVHHTVSQREGENHQRCVSARAGSQDTDVQFLGVQRFALPLMLSNAHR